MLKKIASLVLSLAMLLSVLGVSAAVVDETSNGVARITYTDNFNDQVDGTTVNEKDSTSSGNPYTGDVLAAANITSSSGATGRCSKGSAVMTAGAGPDGSTAMVFPAKSDLRRLATKSLDINTSSEKEYKLSFDFKVSSNTNTVNIMTHGGTFSVLFTLAADGKIMRTTSGNEPADIDSGATYSADTWYHVVSITKGQKMIGWLCDAAGNSLAYSESERITQNTWLQIFNMESSSAKNVTLTLDNVELVEYNPATVNPTVTSAPVTDDAEGVQRNVALKFEFDQRVSIDETVAANALCKVNSDESTTPVSGAALSVDSTGLKVTITYTGLLERNKKYVVSFANLKNASGLYCSETYEFTTEDLHLWEPVTISSIGSRNEDTLLTPISFTISDSYGYPTFDGSVLVMVYQDGKMTGYDMQTLTNQATSSCTKNFNVGTIPTGAKVCVVLLNCESGPIPLASGIATK